MSLSPLHLVLALAGFAAVATAASHGRGVEQRGKATVEGSLRNGELNTTFLRKRTARHSFCDRPRSPNALSSCRPCRLAKEDAPKLWILQRNDGCGARLQEIISGMAVAARNGMNLGGVLSRNVCRESHGADIFRTVAAVFQLRRPEDLFRRALPEMDASYKGITDMERHFVRGSDFKAGGNVLINRPNIAAELDRWDYDISLYYSPRFLTALRGASAKFREAAAAFFDSSRPHAAFHVRRGDVNFTDPKRFTPDEWYHKLADEILKVEPRTQIHIFSSTEGFYTLEDFSSFQRSGFKVHLDNDILEDWAHFARADILVTAKSSFSYVPALLSESCVIYQPYWHKPMPNWIVASEDPAGALGPAFEAAQLRSCLARRKSSSEEPEAARHGDRLAQHTQAAFRADWVQSV